VTAQASGEPSRPVQPEIDLELSLKIRRPDGSVEAFESPRFCVNARSPGWQTLLSACLMDASSDLLHEVRRRYPIVVTDNPEAP
jgi:hypothetical protein